MNRTKIRDYFVFCMAALGMIGAFWLHYILWWLVSAIHLHIPDYAITTGTYNSFGMLALLILASICFLICSRTCWDIRQTVAFMLAVSIVEIVIVLFAAATQIAYVMPIL
jgi:hypothetical protein